MTNLAVATPASLIDAKTLLRACRRCPELNKHPRKDIQRTMNLCCACNTDFASVSAFDKHRIGKHAYAHSEGLTKNPPVEDGRRCMDEDEIRAAAMELDARGRWTIAADRKRITEYWWKAA